MAEQKVVLITGGTAGLGAAVAKAFAPDFRVVVNYANNSSRAEALIDELNKIPSTSTSSPASPRFEAVQADLGDRPSIKRMVDETVSKFGRLDVVVSNVGWTRITDFSNLDENMDDELWDTCFLYNIKSHLWLFHAARDALTKSEGAFVTTSSLAGHRPGGSSLPYSVTKSALIHLSKSLAVIAAPSVRVNCICPGLLMTEWGERFPQEFKDRAISATKLKRLPTVEDCADAVRTLALNRSMTGKDVIVDGGVFP